MIFQLNSHSHQQVGTCLWLFISFTSLVGIAFCQSPQNEIIIRPKAVSAILSNPGMGLQTSDHLRNRTDSQDLLPSSSAYLKYYWYEFEPEDGKYDFSKLERNLIQAREADQKVSLRLMIVDEQTSAQPWLKRIGIKGFDYQYNEAGIVRSLWSPSFDDPTFLARHRRLLMEIGRRFGSDPQLDFVDIGSVGLWGEWHFSATKPQVPMPRIESARQIIDQYFEAFPQKKKIMQIAEPSALAYAISRGAGWRADCFGNLGYHMSWLYPQNLNLAKAQDVWKTAPVALEVCWDLITWQKKQLNLDAIFNWGLTQHASLFNPKKKFIPPVMLPQVQAFLEKLGYRFILNELRHPGTVKPGMSFSVKQFWQNAGVAPCYGNYKLSYELLDPTGKVALEASSSQALCSWLPGSIEFQDQIHLPDKIRPGKYSFYLKVFDSADPGVNIRLAVDLPSDQGRYLISQLMVE